MRIIKSTRWPNEFCKFLLIFYGVSFEVLQFESLGEWIVAELIWNFWSRIEAAKLKFVFENMADYPIKLKPQGVVIWYD